MPSKSFSTDQMTGSEASVPDAEILGVRVHRVTSADIESIVLNTIRSGQRGMFFYVHLHLLNLAYDDPKLRNALNSSKITYCDGEGVRLGARILGIVLPERIPLTRWIFPFLDFCGRNGLSVYFIGTEPRIISRAVDLLRQRFPSLSIRGFHDGFFHSTEGGTGEVLDDICRTKPDIVIVGMGSPLQELWLRDNHRNISAPVAFTAGSCFDYIAGEKPACPRWMADNGLEWLHRLFHEPRRVWKRYLGGIPLFIFRLLKQRLGL